jgi:glycosyltransferase involved in cell wall biosynthesis
VPDRLNIYFMGSFHLSYEDNFAALIEGAGLWARRSGIAPRIIIRGGAPTSVGGGAGVDLEVRPWATQEAVAEDLEEADLLYMPLPFGGEHAPLVEFSLSTKLVTYLGSGIPILYHGPEGGAERLLREEGAAIVVSDLGAEAMVEGFEAAARSGEQVAGKALALARRQFSLDEIRARFWGAVADSAR